MRRDSEIKVEISEELIQRLEQLEDRRDGHPGWPWTPEKDAALLRFWKIKRHEDVAKVLGCSRNTALERYRELTRHVAPE
jgi:hypothetical protein